MSAPLIRQLRATDTNRRHASPQLPPVTQSLRAVLACVGLATTVCAAAQRREALYQRQLEFDAVRYAGAAIDPPDTSYLPAYGYYPPYVKAHRPKSRSRAESPRAVPRRLPAVIRPLTGKPR